MKRYKFEIIIEEGNDEFWDEIIDKTGCDEVTEVVKDMFLNGGWEPTIKLVQYTDGN